LAVFPLTGNSILVRVFGMALCALCCFFLKAKDKGFSRRFSVLLALPGYARAIPVNIRLAAGELINFRL